MRRIFSHKLSAISHFNAILFPLHPHPFKFYQIARTSPINGMQIRQMSYRARFRAMLIRDRAKWTVDDALALLSWIFVSHTLFFVVGTTSFVSLGLAVANSLQFQGLISIDNVFSRHAFLLFILSLIILEFVAGAVRNHVSRLICMEIDFKSAIVPRWQDGTILFKNICIRKDSTSNARFIEAKQNVIPSINDETVDPESVTTYFDLTVDRAELKLSFLRWVEGNGIVESASLFGVRGLVDRRHLDFSLVDSEYWKIRRIRPVNDLHLNSLHVIHPPLLVSPVFVDFSQLFTSLFVDSCLHDSHMDILLTLCILFWINFHGLLSAFVQLNARSKKLNDENVTVFACPFNSIHFRMLP